MTAVISGTNGLLQSYDYQVSTTGFSYTFAAGTQVLVMNPAGTLATGTITMPASPSDGMTITFSSTKIITALTVNANTGQTINNAVTTLAAGQSAAYVYRSASTAWFPYTNVAAASSYVGVASTVFTTTGSGQTFTVPTGITKVKVTVLAGGGAGGQAAAATSAGGGGAGGAAIKWLTVASGTLTVTVGAAGGASSVASGTNNTITTISATAGGAASVADPGTGGVGSNGDLNIRGGNGGAGGQIGAIPGGSGGASIFGANGGGGRGNGSNGSAAGAYGGGGGGGGSGACGGAGGVGTQGVVIFEY